MLDYSVKYKDRNPEETVSIIDNYFKSIGCEVKVLFISQNQISSTWASQVALYWNDNFIIRHNGKGTTKEYCMASAYSELYERFCNKMFYCNKHPFNKILKERALSTRGWFLHPEEKIISFEDAFYQTIATKYFYENIETKNHDLKKFFDKVFENQYIGVPWINAYNKNDKIFLDPRIINYVTGSSGMATGNTFYEAYVQAMSELYEHFVTGRYYTDIKDKYFYLNLNKIDNPLLKKIIEQIEDKGNNKLYIFDMSYNFNVPVLMSLIINKNTHAITVNLGSSPIFDIALERVLTELYQGYNLNHNKLKSNGQFPCIQKDIDLRFRNMKWANSQSYSPLFQEEILLRGHEIDIYNKDIFLRGQHTNEELYKYMEILNKKNNFNIYYLDVSGTTEITALKLFCINTDYFLQDFSYATTIKVENSIECASRSYDLIDTYIRTGDFDLEEYLNLFYKVQNLTESETCYYDHIIYDPYNMITGCNELTFKKFLELGYILYFHKNDLIDIKDTGKFNVYNNNVNIYKELINVATALRFYSNPEYDKEKTNKILNILDINITLDEIISLFEDNKKLIKQVAFADLNVLKNGYYDDYIELLLHYNDKAIQNI